MAFRPARGGVSPRPTIRAIRAARRYPARYRLGNADEAASYVPRVSRALQKPSRWLGKFDTAMIWCDNQGLGCRETT